MFFKYGFCLILLKRSAKKTCYGIGFKLFIGALILVVLIVSWYLVNYILMVVRDFELLFSRG